MAKIIKKKFQEIDLPLINEKFESYVGDLKELEGRTVKVDLTRKLRGKSLDMTFKIVTENDELVAHPKKLTLMPFFIKHMLHTGVDYVEDSIVAETKNSQVIIKPFLITRKKVSRAVRKTIRNSAKNWIVDYLKEKTDEEVFQEILSNQIQKPLSLKLKKVYPLAICEIRIFEVLKPLSGKEKEVGTIEVKKDVEETESGKEIKEEITEEIQVEEKPKKKASKKKEKEE